MKLLLFVITTILVSHTYSMTCDSVFGGESNSKQTIGSEQVKVADLIKESIGKTTNLALALNVLRASIVNLQRSKYQFTSSEIHELVKALEPGIGLIEPSELSKWLYFIEGNGFVPNRVFIGKLQKEYIENSEQFKQRAIAMILLFMGSTNFSPSMTFHSSLVEHFFTLRPKMSPADLYHFSKAYIRLFPVSQSRAEIINELQNGFVEHSGKYDFRTAVFFVAVISKSQRKFTEKFVTSLISVLRSNINSASVPHIAGLFTAMNEVSLDLTGGLINSLLDIVRSNLTENFYDELVTISYQLFVSGKFHLARSVLEDPLLNLQGLTDSSKFQLHTMELYYAHVLKAPLRGLSKELTNYNREVVLVASPPTNLERKMEKSLIEQNVTYVLEFVTSAGFPVDAYVEDKNLIIQANGPWHYIILENGQKILVPKNIRSIELHEALGYTVLILPYWVFN